jgi:hypothetical protein
MWTLISSALHVWMVLLSLSLSLSLSLLFRIKGGKKIALYFYLNVSNFFFF